MPRLRSFLLAHNVSYFDVLNFTTGPGSYILLQRNCPTLRVDTLLCHVKSGSTSHARSLSGLSMYCRSVWTSYYQQIQVTSEKTHFISAYATSISC